MYSIGNFSKINKITTKTLRHYDRIGLLKPALIDVRTGYRFYSAEQLPVIRNILILKELGFTLSEIQQITNDESTLGSFLIQREKQIQQTIRKEQQMLVGVREYLVKIKGERIMRDQVQINPIVAKVGGRQSQDGKGADVVCYFKPLPTRDLASSGFPAG